MKTQHEVENMKLRLQYQLEELQNKLNQMSIQDTNYQYYQHEYTIVIAKYNALLEVLR